MANQKHTPADSPAGRERLMAAAPDLYAAAKKLLEDIERWPAIHEGGDYLHGGMTLALRRALAKAEGRQP